MLLKIDHCSICVISASILSALLTISSLYGLVSLIVSSILPNYLSCSIFCCIVFVLIISPVSTFLYTNLVWSYCWIISLFCPPILEFNGKNVVVSSLPFISLKDFYDFLLGYLVCRFVLPLPYPAFVVTFPALSVPWN